jgi:DNA-binding IclR family transcriptional regulator
MEQGAQSIYRAVAILKELANRNSLGSGMTELAGATGLTGPTVHRMLRALVDVGLAHQRSPDRRYVLGPLLQQLCMQLGPPPDLASIARAATERLAELTGDTAFFLRRTGAEMLCVSRTSGSFPVKTLLTEVGTRRLLGLGAGGLAVLARLPKDEAMALLVRNKAAYREAGRPVETLLAEMEETAASGHAVRRLAELGATTVATALCDGGGRPFAALSMSAISQRMDGTHLEDAIRHLDKMRGELQESLLFATPPAPEDSKRID